MKKCRNCSILKKFKELQERIVVLEKENTIDFLTHLLNRKGISRLVEEEIERYGRYGEKFSVIFIDVDDLKKINNIGWLAGDYVLKKIAAIIKSCIRQSDKAGRLGGDEFLILLSHTKIGQAVRLAERIRSLIEKKKYEFEGRLFKVSVSIGIGEYRKDLVALNDILRYADAALRQSKKGGKNKITNF